MFADKYNLTRREAQILRLLLITGDVKEMLTRLYVSESTLKTHLCNIYQKCGVHSATELMAKCFREVALENWISLIVREKQK